MFKVGDYIEGQSIVQSNHCGLPWPVDFEGNQYCGCVYVTPKTEKDRIGSRYVDAISGSPLTDEEFIGRKNNSDYDYKKEKDNARNRKQNSAS